MSGPLAAVKVIEFSGIGPGPLAGQLLADQGAHVTVIDRPNATTMPHDINRRGKKAIALDLKCTEGRQIALSLIGGADILIEGFRPGVMERLGLGPEDCQKRLIYGRITGWGQSGSLAPHAGHDLTYLAVSGALSLIGPEGAPPVPPLNLVADYGGGTMFLVFGLLAALTERAQTGRGQVVDAAMIDGVPAMMGLIHAMTAQGNWTDMRGTNWLDGGAPFYRCYRCADDRFVAVGALEPQFYAALLAGLGLDPAGLPEQNDRTYWPQTHARFEAVFASAPMAHWQKVFENTDACVAPVLTVAEAARHPHLKERGTYFERDGALQAQVAPRLSNWPQQPPATPAAVGQDSDDVLSALGYSLAEISALRASGVVG